jgi:hypothetical protein
LEARYGDWGDELKRTTSGPADMNTPRKQAEDMTAPECFISFKKSLKKGRRPDMMEAKEMRSPAR